MLHYRGVAKTTFRKFCDVILCVFGFIVMAYTTTLTLKSWAGGNEALKPPGYCDKKRDGLF
jgi:solute carrier family 36 (proton-coupled amino acid transporter)